MSNYRQSLISSDILCSGACLRSVIKTRDFLLNYQRTSLSLLNSNCKAANLPPEILCAIFEDACRPSLPTLYGANDKIVEAASGYRKTRQAIVTTCTRWRSIGQNYSTLWNKIVIGRTPQFSSLPCSPDLHFLSTEVERSQARPLELHLYISDLMDLTKLVVPRISLLKDQVELASMVYPPELCLIDNILPIIRHENLAHLNVETNAIGYPEAAPRMSSLLDLSTLPFLQRLRLCLRQPITIWSGPSPYVNRLRELTLIGQFDPVGVLDTIVDCLNLETFYWQDDDHRPDALEAIPAIISLPKLRSLYLAGSMPLSTLPWWSGEHIEQLACIPLFRQRDGTILSNTHRPNGLLETFHGASTVFPRLRYIRLGLDGPPSDVNILQFLYAQPTVEEVEFTSNSPTDMLMSGLADYQKDGKRFKLPKLRDVWALYDRAYNEDGVYETEVEQRFVSRRASSSDKPVTLHLHLPSRARFVEHNRAYWPREAALAIESLIEGSDGLIVSGERGSCNWDWFSTF